MERIHTFSLKNSFNVKKVTATQYDEEVPTKDKRMFLQSEYNQNREVKQEKTERSHV